MEILKLTDTTTSYIRLIDNPMWIGYNGEIVDVATIIHEVYFGGNAYAILEHI